MTLRKIFIMSLLERFVLHNCNYYIKNIISIIIYKNTSKLGLYPQTVELLSVRLLKAPARVDDFFESKIGISSSFWNALKFFPSQKLQQIHTSKEKKTRFFQYILVDSLMKSWKKWFFSYTFLARSHLSSSRCWHYIHSFLINVSS